MQAVPVRTATVWRPRVLNHVTIWGLGAPRARSPCWNPMAPVLSPAWPGATCSHGCLCSYRVFTCLGKFRDTLRWRPGLDPFPQGQAGGRGSAVPELCPPHDLHQLLDHGQTRPASVQRRDSTQGQPEGSGESRPWPPGGPCPCPRPSKSRRPHTTGQSNQLGLHR